MVLGFDQVFELEFDGLLSEKGVFLLVFETRAKVPEFVKLAIEEIVVLSFEL